MKKIFTGFLLLISVSAYSDSKIICSNTEIIFNPKSGRIEGKPIDEAASMVNAQIASLEKQGKRVKVIHQSIVYGGFQAVAAGVGNNFVNSQAVQYPTVCLTVEIE